LRIVIAQMGLLVTGTILPLRLSNLATPAKASVPNLEKSDVATLGKAHPA